MPSYTVTYGDDRPSRPSSKFAHPAHGIIGVLGTSGSDPRERGRQRSRQEIEAASRAEYLAKKEHLAKVKEMRDTEKAAEAEKKTSAARAKVLARPDVQAELNRREEMRLANEARKNKPLERLTPEQSLAKGQAEKQQREAVAAGPQFSTLRDGPEYKANINRALLAGQVPDDPRFRGTRYEGSGVVGGPGYNRDSPIPPSQQAIRNLMADQMIPEGFNQRYANVSPGRKLAGKLNDIKIMARREKEEQQPASVSAPVSPAVPSRATEAPTAPAKMMRGMAPQQFTNSGPEFRAALEEQFRNPNGKEQMPTPHQLYTRGNDPGPTWSGVKKFGSDVGESLRGIKDAVDSGAGALIEASVPQFNRANAGAARIGEGISEFANRPLAEGGLRFDPGVRMPKQREVGGATGGSIGAPTSPRQGENPTSFKSGLDLAFPGLYDGLPGLLDEMIPPAYPDAMSSGEASMKANDAWRAEMERAEAEARTFGPPAPKKPKKK